jgi:hypothetical protein
VVAQSALVSVCLQERLSDAESYINSAILCFNWIIASHEAQPTAASMPVPLTDDSQIDMVSVSTPTRPSQQRNWQR